LNSVLYTNKFTGPIAGELFLLSKATSFRIDDNDALCRLDAASTAAADECTIPCPFATCACTQTTCPSGAINSGSTAVNPVAPFYPADDTTCCPAGNTLREKLADDSHLDCSVGRPCAVTTGTAGQGTLVINV
jgi:hypothetical protein